MLIVQRMRASKRTQKLISSLRTHYMVLYISLVSVYIASIEHKTRLRSSKFETIMFSVLNLQQNYNSNCNENYKKNKNNKNLLKFGK